MVRHLGIGDAKYFWTNHKQQVTLPEMSGDLSEEAMSIPWEEIVLKNRLDFSGFYKMDVFRHSIWSKNGFKEINNLT